MTTTNDESRRHGPARDRHPSPARGAFGARIRAAREAEGFSQRELSEKIGVAPPFISQLEQGARLPSDETCSSLAGALPTLEAATLILEAFKLRSPEAARVLDNPTPRTTPKIASCPRFQALIRKIEASGLPPEQIEELAAAWLRTLELIDRRSVR